MTPSLPSLLDDLEAACAGRPDLIAAAMARLAAIAFAASSVNGTDALLEADQVGAKLGLAASTVRRMAARGEIGCVRAPDAVRFTQAQVDEWIRRHERPAHAEITPYTSRPRRAS